MVTDSPWVREAKAEEALRDALLKHYQTTLDAEADLARAKEELAQVRAKERTNDKEDS